MSRTKDAYLTELVARFTVPNRTALDSEYQYLAHTLTENVPVGRELLAAIAKLEESWLFARRGVETKPTTNRRETNQ